MSFDMLAGPASHMEGVKAEKTHKVHSLNRDLAYERNDDEEKEMAMAVARQAVVPLVAMY
jgi:hypothetical protein